MKFEQLVLNCCLPNTLKYYVTYKYVIFIKTKVLLPQPILAILIRPFGFIAPKHFKLFGFPIFQFWACLIKVISETRCAQ